MPCVVTGRDWTIQNWRRRGTTRRPAAHRSAARCRMSSRASSRSSTAIAWRSRLRRPAPRRADETSSPSRLADTELVGIDAAADQRFAQPRRGVDHHLVGAGDRIHRERHARRDRRHHPLDQHADPRVFVADSAARRYARACSDSAERRHDEHRFDQSGSARRSDVFRGCRRTSGRRCLRRCRTSARRTRVGRHGRRARVRSAAARIVRLGRVARHHERRRAPESRLLQPRAVEGLAANQRLVGRRDRVEPRNVVTFQ